MSRHRRVLAAACALACFVSAAATEAAGRYHPRLRFRELRTPHFTIYYHQGEARLAARLAAIAEEVRGELSRRTALDAPAHVHVVLVDQSDVANGWSTPVPYDLIEIAAIPPEPSSFLGNDADWLRTVFAHEYAHVMHLDRAGGWMRAARWLVGRHPATFPNLYVPEWQVEGFATWAESAVTGAGRMHAADVASVTALATVAGRASIDRAGGGIVAWPGGHTPYFLGGRMYEELARRHSEEALGRLTRETARRLPFLGGKAFPKVFGAGAARLWRETVGSEAEPAGLDTAPLTRLTNEGYVVTGPRFVRPGSPSRGLVGGVWFSTQSPHHFPEIRRSAEPGRGVAPVVSRYGGETLSSDGRWVYFDQLEYDGAVALIADLYAYDIESGRTVRLSSGARLVDPDVDGAGNRLAAVQVHDGEKRIVVWSVSRGEDGRPALSDRPERTLGTPGCGYATPRWSPDVSRIVAARQCRGSLPAIVVFEADGAERLVTPDPSTRNITPTWSPDGRMIVFASDRLDHRFKLYGMPLQPPLAPETLTAPGLLVDAPGGAMWPDVAPDGRTVVFTSLSPDGYDVFSAPLQTTETEASRFAAAAGGPSPGSDGRSSSTGAGQGAPIDAAAASRPYSAWPTLLPRAWFPFFSMSGERTDVGASVGAADALAYHAYQVALSWRAAEAATDYAFGKPPVEWSVWYSYNRWRPSFFVAASNLIDTVTLHVAGSSATRTADERTSEALAGVVIPWRRVRVSQTWFAGVAAEERRLPAATGLTDRWRNGLRAGWSLASSRQFGYSISPERGVRLTVNLERVLPALGAKGRATSVTFDGRAYVPALGRHDVVALRAAVAASTGDRSMQRGFELGETGLAPGGFGLGSRSVGLLRGLGSAAWSGAALAVANADYRFLLLRVERGIGPWPFFLRDIHAAVFADLGSTGPRLGALPKPAWSAGVELASRLTLGFSWNLNLAAGAAWVHDPARPGRRQRAAGFVRTGFAF